MKPWGSSAYRQPAGRVMPSGWLFWERNGEKAPLGLYRRGGRLVEGGVEGVEVFAVQAVGEDAEALSEISNLSKCHFPQCFLGLRALCIRR